MIYKRGDGPNARRLWTDPSIKVFLGLLTLGALFVLWYELEPMATFRPVDAVIVGSDVAMVRLNDGHSSFREYQTDIFYRYEVAGTPYMGRKYSRIDLESSSSVSILRASSQPHGGRVQAWYNPLRPEEAVLSRDLNFEATLWTCILLFIAWISCSQRTLGAPLGSEPTRSASTPSPIE